MDVERPIRERDEDDPIGAFKRKREREMYPLEEMISEGELPGGCHRQMFDSSTPPTEAEKRAWLERRYEEILAEDPVQAPGAHYGPQDPGYAKGGPWSAEDPAPSLHGTAAQRKAAPVYSGVLRYFPLALAAVAHCSKVGNDQHNPGEPLHWAREKSTDEGDALARHLLEAGTRDADGVRHATKVAWRALALLQKEIENDGGRL